MASASAVASRKGASVSKSAELTNILASTAPVTVNGATVNVKIPTDTFATAAPVKTAPAAAEPIKTPSAAVKSVTVDGFTLTLFAGDIPQNLVKDNVVRGTSNPWYPVMVWLAGCKPGYVEIQRNDDSLKSPKSKIDNAITRCRNAGVAHYGKLDVRSGATKGTWYLIRRA
jgi:hypothetical protein